MNTAIRITAAVAVFVFGLATIGCGKSEQLDAHKKKGNELFEKGEFAQAADEFEKSYQLNPKQDIKALEKTAFSFMKAGKQDKTAEFLLKTLPLRPDTAGKLETYRNIAGMYLQASNGEKAEQYFAEAVKLEPKDEQSLTWLAEIASQRGGARVTTGAIVPEQLDKAIALYNRLVEINPASPLPYINKRIALYKYIDHLTGLKQTAEASANAKKKDKAAFDALTEEANKHQAKIDELKIVLDETSKKLGEVQKAAKAGK